jgi:tRNA nucleotidyltransferase/poly(A) polymerase
LEVENSYTYITLLDEVGLLSAIIPEVSSLKLQHTSFWHHSFETFRLMEEWSGNLQNFFPRWHSRIEEYLVELIADNRSRLSALKFLSLLHPLNEVKPPSSIARIMRRLRLSNRECQLAAKMTESLHQANTFLITKKFTNKMLYSFFKKLGVDGIGVLFIALADTYQRKRGRKCFETIDEIFNKFYTQIFLTPLLNGRDIIEHFKLVSGPLIGKLLIKVEEKRAEGEIKNRMEALQYVEELLKKRN